MCVRVCGVQIASLRRAIADLQRELENEREAHAGTRDKLAAARDECVGGVHVVMCVHAHVHVRVRVRVRVCVRVRVHHNQSCH